MLERYALYSDAKDLDQFTVLEVGPPLARQRSQFSGRDGNVLSSPTDVNNKPSRCHGKVKPNPSTDATSGWGNLAETWWVWDRRINGRPKATYTMGGRAGSGWIAPSTRRVQILYGSGGLWAHHYRSPHGVAISYTRRTGTDRFRASLSYIPPLENRSVLSQDAWTCRRRPKTRDQLSLSIVMWFLPSALNINERKPLRWFRPACYLEGSSLLRNRSRSCRWCIAHANCLVGVSSEGVLMTP